MYTVEFTKEASRFLKKQDVKTVMRIKAKINELARDPFAPNNNVTKLVDRDGYRLRVGDIRVLYVVFEKVLVVSVFEIGFRGSIYSKGRFK